MAHEETRTAFTTGRTRYRWLSRGVWRRQATVAETMLAWEALRELGDRRLSVILIPAERQSWPGHMVRAVDNENPDWYQRLQAAACPCPGKCQGGHIKRTRVHRALSRVASGWVDQRGYEQRILPLLTAQEAAWRARWHGPA